MHFYCDFEQCANLCNKRPFTSNKRSLNAKRDARGISNHLCFLGSKYEQDDFAFLERDMRKMSKRCYSKPVIKKTVTGRIFLIGGILKKFKRIFWEEFFPDKKNKRRDLHFSHTILSSIFIKTTCITFTPLNLSVIEFKHTF